MIERFFQVVEWSDLQRSDTLCFTIMTVSRCYGGVLD